MRFQLTLRPPHKGCVKPLCVQISASTWQAGRILITAGSVMGNGISSRVTGVTFFDPTAGSPTVTLLRLILPLKAQTWFNISSTTPFWF